MQNSGYCFACWTGRHRAHLCCGDCLAIPGRNTFVARAANQAKSEVENVPLTTAAMTASALTPMGTTTSTLTRWVLESGGLQAAVASNSASAEGANPSPGPDGTNSTREANFAYAASAAASAHWTLASALDNPLIKNPLQGQVGGNDGSPVAVQSDDTRTRGAGSGVQVQIPIVRDEAGRGQSGLREPDLDLGNRTVAPFAAVPEHNGAVGLYNPASAGARGAAPTNSSDGPGVGTPPDAVLNFLVSSMQQLTTTIVISH